MSKDNLGSSARVHAKSFEKNKWYDQEVVGDLLESLKGTMPAGTYLLNGDGHLHNIGGSDGRTALRVTTNNDELVENLSKVPSSASHAVGIFLVGSGEKGGDLDRQDREGSHYIAAVFNKETNTLTMLDPLGEVGEMSVQYNQFANQISESFKNRFSQDINIENNPSKYFLKQKDANSCGPACAHMVDHLMRGEDLKANAGLGINAKDGGGFELEKGAEELRKSQQKRFAEYEVEAEKKKKRRLLIGEDSSIGFSDVINKLWQEREEELKKILSNYVGGSANLDAFIKNNKAPSKVDELIKFIDKGVKTPEQQQKWDEVVKVEVDNKNIELATKLADEMEKHGQKLDFNQSHIQFDSGNRSLSLDVKHVDGSQLKYVTIDEKALKPDDNFTMSLAFQDKNGENMNKPAFHFQICIDDGKITAVNHPPLFRDKETGQYYAKGSEGEKFYPKLDIKTIERMLTIEKEVATDNVLPHEPKREEGDVASRFMSDLKAKLANSVNESSNFRPSTLKRPETKGEGGRGV